jgi:RHS repeat-associated protein
VSANSYSAFDSYGRVLQSTQIIPALATTVNGITTYPTFTYTYNAVGLTKEVYPSGRTVTIGYDGAGREDTIGGTKSYAASAIQYTAHGAITALPLAAVNLTEQTCYSSRLQPFIIRLASATTTNCANSGMDLLNLTYTYGVTQDSTGNVTSGDDNGNVMSQQIARNGQTTVTQSYTGYDGVNRLTGASETSAWSQSYGYDAYGNRWVSANTDFPLTAFTPTASTNFPAGTNQLNVDGSLFDAAGNMTQIGGWMFKYDAENHQTSAAINTTTSTYAYDGEGRRVQKVSGGETTLYVYDAQGDLMAEYEGPSPSQPPLCQTCYVTVDHLGSTRLEIDGVSGQPVAYHDYLPFGEEVTSVTGDTTTQKFTGKERDAETGLDYFGARYMSSAQGRFTSVDPISGTVLHLLNPQRWNMYAYAVNNPLAYTDPDGRDAIAVKFGNLAHDLGHAGVASVHHDGKGTFADFGPQHGGQAHDAGKYDFIDFKTQIQYGADGKPTKASLTALANELADAELQPHDSVSVAYFKTSDSETAALDAYINAAKAQQAGGKTPTYWVGFRDCIWFCTNGMQKAGVGPGSSTLTVPNFQYLSFWLWADQTATGTNPPKEKVTSKICYNDENGKQVCQ